MRPAYFQIRIIFALAALIGISLLPMINVQLNPSPRSQSLFVTYMYPGTGPDIVEQEVTSLLERNLSRIDHLLTIESTSSNGWGQVELSFDRKVQMDEIRLLVSAEIRQLAFHLPPGVSYPVIQYKSRFASYPTLMVYGVSSDMASASLEALLNREIIKNLTTLPGLHEVTLEGLIRNEFIVEANEHKMQALGITFDMIRQASGNSSLIQDLGFVQDPLRTNIESVRWKAKELKDIDQLHLLPIAKIHGRIIHLGEVAKIYKRTQAVDRHYRINGKQSVHMIITADQSVNQIRLANQIRKIIAGTQSRLGENVEFELKTDKTELLKSELNTIIWRMGAALFILFLLMIIIYRRLSSIKTVWYGFFVTLFISVIIFYFVGLELHSYSLAGLTLSLGIVLDNLIVMSEHLRHSQNQRIFVALLAATLTTVGALSIIFFIAPEYREMLTDFVLIFSITVGMSLLVSLFLLPAITVKSEARSLSFTRRKGILFFTRQYHQYIQWVRRKKWLLSLMVILGFGVPLFLLPSELKQSSPLAAKYNDIMGGYYGKKIHPTLSKYLGGTLRLFVLNKDQFNVTEQKKEQTKLIVSARMPFGGTGHQLNALIKSLEVHLQQFDEIDQFTSLVNGPENATIEITFKNEYDKGIFPYQLKANLESMAILHGAADLSIYGVGMGFSNSVAGERLSTHLRLWGYNYDRLWQEAQAAGARLLEHMRIQSVFINSRLHYNAPGTSYFLASPNVHSIAEIGDRSLNTFATNWMQSDPNLGLLGSRFEQGHMLPIQLHRTDKTKNDLWHLQNDMQRIDSSRYYRNKEFTQMERRMGAYDIVRHNQQYQLFVEYDFIGNQKLADKVKKAAISEISGQLPPGYVISDEEYGRWWRESGYALSYIVLGSLLLIFIISAILFNSVRQALVPLALVPISFIGIFLTTFIFDFRFDQGGFASLLLVAGLSVNAGIFIINDYNNLERVEPRKSAIQRYLRAYNLKIVPISLTLLSTVLGLLPFILFQADGVFWYPLAICTISGLIFSFVGILFLMPPLVIQTSERINLKTESHK